MDGQPASQLASQLQIQVWLQIKIERILLFFSFSALLEGDPISGTMKRQDGQQKLQKVCYDSNSVCWGIYREENQRRGALNAAHDLVQVLGSDLSCTCTDSPKDVSKSSEIRAVIGTTIHRRSHGFQSVFNWGNCLLKSISSRGLKQVAVSANIIFKMSRIQYKIPGDTRNQGYIIYSQGKRQHMSSQK